MVFPAIAKEDLNKITITYINMMYIFPKIYFSIDCLVLHNKLPHIKGLGVYFPKPHLIQTLAEIN